jgi:serine protease Do
MYSLVPARLEAKCSRIRMVHPRSRVGLPSDKASIIQGYLMRSLLIACLLLSCGIAPAQENNKPEAYFLVPYRLSDVKHVVIRVKVNGKGPFNMVVDTGAPAVYFGSEMAKQLGLEPKEAGYWETFDNVEIESGLKLDKFKARIEEPFQLVGMNKINAAGIRYHGVLGYTVLAQFQITYDFTEPHLKFTMLNWKPPAPVAMGSLSEGATKNMKAMIGLSSMATSFIAKRKDATYIYRGLIGIELEEADKTLTITKVIDNTPATLAELKMNDKLLSINDKAVDSLTAAHKVMSNVGTEEEVTLQIERAGEKKIVKLKTARGF